MGNGYKSDDVASFQIILTASSGLALPQLQPQRRTLYSSRVQSWVRQVATRDCSSLTAAFVFFFFFFFIQQESGLPGSKQGDSHPSPTCQATSRVLVEHSVNISIASRMSTILRHYSSRFTKIPVVSDAGSTTTVVHYSISFRRHQRTNVSIAPFQHVEIQLELNKTAPQASALTTSATSPSPPYQIQSTSGLISSSHIARFRLKSHQQVRLGPRQQVRQIMGPPVSIVAFAMRASSPRAT